MDKYAQLIQEKTEEREKLKSRRDVLAPEINSTWSEIYSLENQIKKLESDINALEASKNKRFISSSRVSAIDAQIAAKEESKEIKEQRCNNLKVKQAEREQERDRVMDEMDQCTQIIAEANRIRNAALDAVLEDYFNKNGYPEPLVSVVPSKQRG